MLTMIGTFYLKNGEVIETGYTPETPEERKEIAEKINEIRSDFTSAVVNGLSGTISFGYLTVDISDISAIEFYEMEGQNVS